MQGNCSAFVDASAFFWGEDGCLPVSLLSASCPLLDSLLICGSVNGVRGKRENFSSIGRSAVSRSSWVWCRACGSALGIAHHVAVFLLVCPGAVHRLLQRVALFIASHCLVRCSVVHLTYVPAVGVRRFRFLGRISLACFLLLCSFVGRIWCIFVVCASVWLCPIAMMLHARTYCYWVKEKGWRRDGGFVGLYALFPCKRSLKHEVLVQKAS